VTFILKKKLLYHTKKSVKSVSIFFILVIVIIGIIIFKYKPVYAVTISGEVVGYVGDKVELETKINEEILNHNGNVAAVSMNAFPEYKLSLVSRTEETNEEEIVNSIKDNAEVTYRYYAVTFNGNIEGYLNTLEEAEQLVDEIKKENNGNLDLNIGIREYYTINVDDAKNIEENTDIIVAKEQIEQSIDKEARTVNGVYLAAIPVQGVVTSRFAAIESVRSGAHTGLDIGAASGSNIYAVADGIVKYAGSMGSYGNLVIISHSNGVESYYAHCSRILVSVGQQISAGDNIALVGSTGNSTGPHLHLEIRINNTPVNPQKYLYRNY
jgi:hypothetical protein